MCTRQQTRQAVSTTHCQHICAQVQMCAAVRADGSAAQLKKLGSTIFGRDVNQSVNTAPSLDVYSLLMCESQLATDVSERAWGGGFRGGYEGTELPQQPSTVPAPVAANTRSIRAQVEATYREFPCGRSGPAPRCPGAARWYSGLLRC